MFQFFPLVLKNCWRNRRRTSLTIASIAASLSLLGILLAIYHALYFGEPTPEQALRLVTRNKVSLVFPMPESYRAKIRQVPGVREVMTSQWFGGKYKDNRPENMFARFAIEPEYLFTIHGEMQIPEEQKKAFLKERRGCVVGKPLADKYGWKVGDRFTIQGDIFPGDFEFLIMGIYDAPDNNETMYFHRKYLEESLGGRFQGRVGTFAILAASADAVPQVARAIDEEFRNSPVSTKTEAERAFQLSFVNAMGNIKVFVMAICGAVVFTVLLVSANTMAMSVRERVREVGILKTLGFTSETILSMILGEAVMLSILGGMLGLVIAMGLCLMVRQAPIPFMTQLKALTLPPAVALGCLGIAAVVGFVSALFPAWNASRTPIIDALRATD